ncbi:MAG TPA: hypothetical protein VK689_07620 [Armatimonadota bacterium]|nr:hypothetical protein [Armatimonadota bacterium]
MPDQPRRKKGVTECLPLVLLFRWRETFPNGVPYTLQFPRFKAI